MSAWPADNAFDADKSIREQVGRGWALEIETFLGSVKWHRAVRQVPFGAKKSQDFQGPTHSHLPK
jgi:hypothetical protein